MQPTIDPRYGETVTGWLAALVATAALHAPAPCAHAQLRFHLGRGDGAAGHVFWPLIFTNVSDRACTLRGYPGVSSVARDDGHQLGPAGTREPHRVRTVTLRARGGRATATLNHVNPDVVDPAQCHKTSARGYRVFAPGQTRAFFAPQKHTVCRIGRFPDSVRPVT
jgi:Domain of unknown function (DUF4232)